jgi:hypothetical protein
MMKLSDDESDDDDEEEGNEDEDDAVVDSMMKPSDDDNDDDDNSDDGDKLPQEEHRTQRTALPSSPLLDSAGNDATDVENQHTAENR